MFSSFLPKNDLPLSALFYLTDVVVLYQGNHILSLTTLDNVC